MNSVSNRYSTNLHPAMTNLSTFQRGTYYSAIKVFNHLPSSIESLPNKTELFRPALKRLLLSNSFYSID